MSAPFDPLRVLRTLAAHDVRYVVIGGFAAWVQGAPLLTSDIDLIFDTAEDNILRLVTALLELDAVYRHQFGRRIEPSTSGLSATTGGGHHLFETSAGDVDVLRASGDRDFEKLQPAARRFELDEVTALFAPLEQIIEMKIEAARPKDIAALPVLRAALEQNDDA